MIVMQDTVRVNVSPLSAYEHLVRFEEYPRFMSGVLSITALDSSSAHLALDIGGQRVEVDAMLADPQPGRLVHWDSPALTETFRLNDAEDGCTDVSAVVRLDEHLVCLFDQAPESILRSRLRVDLKGLKRFCEECSVTTAPAVR